MSEWEDRIGSILSDPAQMEEIERLARSLMGGGESGGGETPPAPPEGLELPDAALLGRVAKLLQGSGASSGREKALLEAMKPYLSDKRQGKLERAMKLAHMAKLASLALGEGGNGDV